jgi:hypothetical protein
MANTLGIQTIVDGPRNLIVKITAELTTSDLAATQVVTPLTTFTVSQMNPPPLVRLNYIDYSISDPLQVTLYWGNSTGPAAGAVIMPLAGRGRMSFDDFKGLTNNQSPTDGSIWISTTGYAESPDTGNAIFTVILELIKAGEVGVGVR